MDRHGYFCVARRMFFHRHYRPSFEVMPPVPFWGLIQVSLRQCCRILLLRYGTNQLRYVFAQLGVTLHIQIWHLWGVWYCYEYRIAALAMSPLIGYDASLRKKATVHIVTWRATPQKHTPIYTYGGDITVVITMSATRVRSSLGFLRHGTPLPRLSLYPDEPGN